MPSPSAPLCTRDYVLLNAANLTFSLYTTIFLFLPAYLYRLGISIEFTINLLRDGDGKVLGPVAVVRDATARWSREKALRQRQAFLEAGQTAA